MPDSTADTKKHIARVQELVGDFTALLVTATQGHDASKLLDPEKKTFDTFGPRLKHLKYGTPEYASSLAHMQEALDVHYAANRHHPEHHKEGIYGMDLFDLGEMLADWKAAGERHKDNLGLRHSIEINAERFGYDERFKNLLLRTAGRLEWL